MRLAKLELLAFGHFRGLALDFSRPGLHVVIGRNEAGKSTTLRAITGLLYGIDRQTQDAHVHKPTDLRIGGVLEGVGGERVRIVRRKGNTNTLLDEMGQPLDDTFMKRLLGGVSEETFRNAYGLDHDTLERGAKALLEGRGDLGESLFDASVGGGGGAVQRLLTELTNEADRIYKPKATTLPLNEALRELDIAQKLVRERQSLPEAFLAQEKGLTTSMRERAERSARLTELRARRARLNRAKKRVPLERRRQRALEQRTTLGELANQVARVEALKDRFEAYKRALEQRRSHVAEAERLVDRVVEASRRAGVDPKANTDALDALRLEAGKEARVRNLLKERTTLSERLEYLRNEIARAERELSRLKEPSAREGAKVFAHQAADVARLSLALMNARALGDAETRIATERSRCERRQSELEARTASLGMFDRETVLGGKASKKKTTSSTSTSTSTSTSSSSTTSTTSESLDLFVALPLPAVASVERLEERAVEIGRTISRLEERRVDLEKEAAALEKQRAALAGDFAPPDASELRRARAARDERWKELVLLPTDHRPALRAAEMEFERLLRETDGIADRMIHEADRVTTLARLRSEADANAKHIEKVASDKARAIGERSALDRELTALFADAGIKPRGFAEMSQWLDRHVQIADAYRSLREAQADINEEAKKVEVAKVALVTAMAAFEGAPSLTLLSVELPESSDDASESVEIERLTNDEEASDADSDDDEDEDEEDEEAAISISPASLASPLESESPLFAYARSRQLQQREQQGLTAKSKKPSGRSTKAAKKGTITVATKTPAKKPTASLSSVGVTSGLDEPRKSARHHKLSDLIVTAAHRLSEIESARLTGEEAARGIVKIKSELEDRIAARERDEAALSDVNARVSEILGPMGVPTDAAVEEVNRSIDALRELFAVVDKHADTEVRVRVAEADVIEFEADLARAVTDLAPDLETSSPRDAATEIFARAGMAKVNLQEIATIDARLEELGGDAASEDAERALVMDPDPEFVVRAEADLDLEIEEVETAIERLDQSIGGAKFGLDKLRADSNAAEAASQAQEAIARLRENVERYARVKLASVLLSREIERYRQENQAPLLASSSTLFSRLTLGAYVGVKAGFDDKDKPCLRCVRADGTTEVDVTGLSDGTRDQLYLSLRLSSLLRHAEITEPMPLVLDDVLIQLDDQRASAALGVLAEVSRKMQVLFFTHHARLVDLARAAVPAGDLIVHELASTSPPSIEVSA